MQRYLFRWIRLPALMFGLPVGWLNGRKEISLLRHFYSFDKGWQPVNVVLGVTAVAVGGVSSNLLAAMVSQDGWAGAFSRSPLKATIYAGLIVACAVATTVIVAR
jgi:hypothetical protein